MPRPANFDSLTRDDLLLAVRDLVARGRVTADEVRAYGERAKRIAELEAQLARLRGEGVSRSPRAPRVARAPAAKPKRRITNTPKRQAALKVQGQYLGRLKKLAPRIRARVQALAKKSGVAAAVKLADRLLPSG